MKKTLIITVLSLICALLPSTGYKRFCIIRTESTNPYERILKAISATESKNGTFIYNKKENAVGVLQIRPIRLKDYNLRTGKNLKLNDCYNYKTSKMIFLYYASRFKPNDYESISKDWNKSRTDKYWNLVKMQLKN
jgi:hypothetical protein